MTRHVGRHRQEVRRAGIVQRLGACAVLVGGAGLGAVALAGSASADAPVQTGWWGAASPAPSPTTPEGGLHIAVEPGAMTAYGAMLFTFPEGATGTLELQIAQSATTPAIDPNAPGSTNPAMRVFACPITSTSWKAGDNQPMDDSAPDFDCSVSKTLGNLSADGKVLTFLLDDRGQTVPGQLNLAFVPGMTTDAPGVGTELPADATQPYSLDIAKPSATSLMVTGGTTAPTGGLTDGTTGSDTSDATTPAAASGGSQPVSSGGDAPMPPALTGSGPTTGSTTDAAPPVVAPTGTAVPAAVPAAASAPSNDRAHNAALAMLLLIGIGIAAMSNGQLQRAPRLLGGGRNAQRQAALATATAGGAAPAAGTPEAMAAAMVMAPYGVRGLGRFNKPRTAPPRPLI